MATQLRLRRGYPAFKCAVCGKEETLSHQDGDTVNPNIPGAETVAGGLALSANGHCYYASLNVYLCKACGGQCYIVDLCTLNAPEISQDWADTYFMMNQKYAETPLSFTVVCPEAVSGIPAGLWGLERMETVAGTFDRHNFGPFATDENLIGPNGVANCMGGAIWQNAAALVERVWPLIIAKANQSAGA